MVTGRWRKNRGIRVALAAKQTESGKITLWEKEKCTRRDLMRWSGGDEEKNRRNSKEIKKAFLIVVLLPRVWKTSSERPIVCRCLLAFGSRNGAPSGKEVRGQ